MINKCIMNMERIICEMNLSQWMCHTFTVVGVFFSSYLCSFDKKINRSNHNQQGRVRSCTYHLTSIVCMPSILDFFIHYAKLMSTNGFPVSTLFIPFIMPPLPQSTFTCCLDRPTQEILSHARYLSCTD